MSKQNQVPGIPELPDISKLMNIKLPPDARRFTDDYMREENQALRNVFKGEIKGGFLIEIKSRVLKCVSPLLFNLYDFHFSQDTLVRPKDSAPTYDICNHIIGIHRANTIFLSLDEISQMQKDENYKEKLTLQVCEQVLLRGFGSAYFRSKTFVVGDRFAFYPIPYEMFVLCVRMNGVILQEGAKGQTAYYFGKIINKAMSALVLMEDNFLASAYLPCRTVIELYVKLLLLREHPGLIQSDIILANWEIQQACCNQVYPKEFTDAFNNRTNRREHNKIEYLHFGFVDGIPDYHKIVKKKPYTVSGLIEYLMSQADDSQYKRLETLQTLYKMCHGYTHGNIDGARFPLLHYFEISLILGNVIPDVYRMFCEDYEVESDLFGIDMLGIISKNMELLETQHSQRSTENFEMELGKYSK